MLRLFWPCRACGMPAIYLAIHCLRCTPDPTGRTKPAPGSA